MPEAAPPEPPAAGERLLKLNTHEAPLAPSPRVIAAIRELEPERLRAYPSPTGEAFLDAAARYHGLEPTNILAGNGSEDVLAVLIRTFVPADGLVASPAPTTSLYAEQCAAHGARFVPVDWLADWELPVSELVSSRPDAVILANPNMPSGTLAPAAAVGELARRSKCMVIVDEAYADFADENCLALLADHDNLVIVRTLSHGYALAGLRFGYALAHEQVVRHMMKVKGRYNTSALAQAAAVAALEDQEHAQRLRDHVRAERGRLTLELGFMGFHVPRSHANFLLARHKDGIDGGRIREGLRKQGVLVEGWKEPALADAIGITIGTSQENDAFLGALEAVVGRSGPSGEPPQP